MKRLSPSHPDHKELSQLIEEYARQKNIAPYDNFAEPKYRRIADDMNASLLDEIENILTLGAFK